MEFKNLLYKIKHEKIKLNDDVTSTKFYKIKKNEFELMKWFPFQNKIGLSMKSIETNILWITEDE